jgi:transcription initiation factor IIE alpha subunit
MKKLLLVVFAFMISGTIIFAQDTTKTERTNKMKAEAEMQKDSVYYTCPMHSDIKMDKTGKCAKCGMDLEKHQMKSTGTSGNKSDAMQSYTCPMHSEVTSEKPGKCPKCGMDLVPKK